MGACGGVDAWKQVMNLNWFNVKKLNCVVVGSLSRSLKRNGLPMLSCTLKFLLFRRSFDHMCGFLKQLNSNIDGLKGNETCPLDPEHRSLGSAKVTSFQSLCSVIIRERVEFTARNLIMAYFLWSSNNFPFPYTSCIITLLTFRFCLYLIGLT